MNDIRRTQEMIDHYATARAQIENYSHVHQFDPLVDIVVREFTQWYIIENNFPYDRIFAVHHLLVPKRVFGSLTDASKEERDEYEKILTTLDDEGHYDALQINFNKKRSVRVHYHAHLFAWKKPTAGDNIDHENT